MIVLRRSPARCPRLKVILDLVLHFPRLVSRCTCMHAHPDTDVVKNLTDTLTEAQFQAEADGIERRSAATVSELVGPP